MNIRFYSTILFFIFIINTFTAASDLLNLQFETQRHPANLRFAGLANTGTAIPDAPSSVMINPALIHSWHYLNSTKYSGEFFFERDSLFSRYIISTCGSSYINDKMTFGVLYRALKKDGNYYSNEMVFNYSGRLFDKSMNQGAVNIGINIRYETLKWKQPLDSLQIRRYTYNDSGKIINDSILKNYPPSPFLNTFDERRILFDLGFFQGNIFDGLDFGLVFYNLFGYKWLSENPVAEKILITDTTTKDSIVIDSAFYADKWQKTNEKINRSYKRMRIGLAYHNNLISENFSFLIPFDLEFIGIFDKKQKTKTGLHTGIELWLFSNKICFRFGYAFSPEHIYGLPGTLAVKNVNIFSGGMSIIFNHISFTLYLHKFNWGIGSVISF